MSAAATDLTLRDELRASDRPALERILIDSKYFRTDEVPVALQLMDDRLAKGEHSEYRFIVVEREGKVVGYCCYGLIACSVHSYDLYWIAVEPTLQRAGIGRKLMAATEERVRAKEGKRIYVETSSKPQYEPTRQFYLRCGYKPEATLEDFYAPGDGKLIFVKIMG